MISLISTDLDCSSLEQLDNAWVLWAHKGFTGSLNSTALMIYGGIYSVDIDNVIASDKFPPESPEL